MRRRFSIEYLFLSCRSLSSSSSIPHQSGRRAPNKLQTYGRFDALVVRQFTISLLNFWWEPLVSARTATSAHRCFVVSAGDAQCVLPLEGDNQCGVRNWQNASCDNNCHYYPFKYSFGLCNCIRRRRLCHFWSRSEMHKQTTPDWKAMSIHHSNGFVCALQLQSMRVCAVCTSTLRNYLSGKSHHADV